MINPLHPFRSGIPPEEGPAELRQWRVRGRFQGRDVEAFYDYETDGSSRHGERLFRDAFPGGTLVESGLA